MKDKKILEFPAYLITPIKSLKTFINYKILEKSGTSHHYQRRLLAAFAAQHSLKNKIMLEIGSDLDCQTALGMLRLGAKKVYCVNPKFDAEFKSPNKNITLIKSLGENTDFEDESFDIIFGIALLEHVNDPKRLVTEIKRLLKPSAIAYLHGDPLWTCASGHHVWYKSGHIKCIFSDLELNPFEDWEHLLYDTKEELTGALMIKNFPEGHAKSISKQIFSNVISRFSPTKIINLVQSVDGIDILVKRRKEIASPNKIFHKLKEKYTQEDLLTKGIHLFIKKCA